MGRAVFLMLAVTVTLLVAGGAAVAQTVPWGAPDAGCPGPRDFRASLEDGRAAAQTFTATRSGRLTAAEVLVNEQTNLGSGDPVLKISQGRRRGRPHQRRARHSHHPRRRAGRQHRDEGGALRVRHRSEGGRRRAVRPHRPHRIAVADAGGATQDAFTLDVEGARR